MNKKLQYIQLELGIKLSNISLPSIPGKTIKFKIQDIKTAAFGVQKARFPDNKALLTKKFVDSFHNFHPIKQQDDTLTQAETQLSKSFVGERKQMQFRSIFAENKKYLLPLQAEIKKQEQQKISKSLQPNPKINSGYSFARAGLNNQNENNVQVDYQQNSLTRNDNYTLTDNYYFTLKQKQKDLPQNGSKPKPSAVFKNQTRIRAYDKINYQSSLVPGPGAYIPIKEIKQKAQKNIKQKKHKNNTIDYKHLKDVIANVLVQKELSPIVNQQQINTSQDIKPDHMFVLDDRDRFGQQIFPIAPKLKVPGPGSYEVNDRLEDKAKKLLLVQQQRKLLKQWFNN